MTDPIRPVADRLVLVAGATSTSGRAAIAALTNAGARVIAVGRDPEKLHALRETTPSVVTLSCDLSDEHAVGELVDTVHESHGRLDGLLHLVGGWRGGNGIAGQSEEDYRFLEHSLTALRHTSRAFHDDLRSSEAGRQAIVSSTAVDSPLAGGANYAAIKAASEAWARSIAHGFRKHARDEDQPLRAASVIYRVKSLSGLEFALADAFVSLWGSPADTLNGNTITLTPDENGVS